MADVNADGMLEIVACDTHGTLAVFTAGATELWERHVKSGIAQACPACSTSMLLASVMAAAAMLHRHTGECHSTHESIRLG